MVGQWGWGGMHCSVDLKWGGAETMAMKKTWQSCEKQPTSITLEGTVHKTVHEKVDVQYGEKHLHTIGLNDSSERYIYTSECTVMPLFV